MNHCMDCSTKNTERKRDREIEELFSEFKLEGVISTENKITLLSQKKRRMYREEMELSERCILIDRMNSWVLLWLQSLPLSI